MRILKTLVGVLLLPVAVGTAKAFYVLISSIDPASGSLHILERGVLIYLLVHVFVFRPAYIYVLGHEFVHVLATWICGGKVLSFNVTPSSGNVVTSKTNFFIELSPYFIPIYTLLLAPIFMILKSIDIYIPYLSGIFLFLIGMTLAFHFVMTTEILKIQQSDIARSGFIFSMILIFIGNLAIVMAVFSPFFESISFVDFCRGAVTYSGDIYRQLVNKLLQLVQIVGVWQI